MVVWWWVPYCHDSGVMIGTLLSWCWSDDVYPTIMMVVWWWVLYYNDGCWRFDDGCPTDIMIWWLHYKTAIPIGQKQAVGVWYREVKVFRHHILLLIAANVDVIHNTTTTRVLKSWRHYSVMGLFIDIVWRYRRVMVAKWLIMIWIWWLSIVLPTITQLLTTSLPWRTYDVIQCQWIIPWRCDDVTTLKFLWVAGGGSIMNEDDISSKY